MKVSLITTVLNEEKTIKDFLKSVVRQSKKPNEFIIVDGGSQDKTVEIIKRYAKKHRWIKLIVKHGASIGKGRNVAIEKAKNKIIACTDAGCILDKNWLKEITKPFLEEKNVDVVVGIYKPHYRNDFEYFQGLVVAPNPEKIFMNPSRMSSRSIAFRKSIWKKVGGYPDLTTGEDTEFNIRLIKSGVRFIFAKNAIVYWRMRETWKDFFKQFYKYGVGDRKSGNIWKMKKNLALVASFWVYLFLIFVGFINIFYTFLLIIAGVSAFLYQGIEVAIKSKKAKGILYGTVLIFIKRISYILGVSFG